MMIDLHVRNQLNICKRLEKSVENSSNLQIYVVHGLEFFTENQWSITKLTLDLQVMVIYLYATNQLSIWKCLEKVWKTDTAD